MLNFRSPNRKHIQSVIDLIASEQRVNMQLFQGLNLRNLGKAIFHTALTQHEFHACGNTACIAGYVGLCQEFKNFGGAICVAHGAPQLKRYAKPGYTLQPADVVAVFFNIPEPYAGLLIYGRGQTELELEQLFDADPMYSVAGWQQWEYLSAIRALQVTMDFDFSAYVLNDHDSLIHYTDLLSQCWIGVA